MPRRHVGSRRRRRRRETLLENGIIAGAQSTPRTRVKHHFPSTLALPTITRSAAVTTIWRLQSPWLARARGRHPVLRHDGRLPRRNPVASAEGSRRLPRRAARPVLTAHVNSWPEAGHKRRAVAETRRCPS